MPEYFAAYHVLLQLKIALAGPALPVFQLLQGHRQNDSCFQTVSHCCCCQCQVFCAYCFRVSTEVTESSNQISIIVINMLVILMLRNALLNVGRLLRELSLSIIFFRASIKTSGLTFTPLRDKASRFTANLTSLLWMIRQRRYQ